MAKKQVLGRGLDALLDSNKSIQIEKQRNVNEIDIDLVEANPYQPRTNFDEESLKELSVSIQEIGLVQPITVKNLDNGKYQLISGERRLRASKLAGLNKIPAYIREADDQGLLEMALVENIQRENLNAIEIAISYKRLMDECNLTQDELSQRVGKKRSTVANYMRLLNLPAKVQLGIRDNKISMGHARALLAANDEDTILMIYEQILKYDFSVRRVEDILKEITQDPTKNNKNTGNKNNEKQDVYKQLQTHLSSYFATNIDFKRNDKGKGKITIPFNNDSDLERIIAILDKITR